MTTIELLSKLYDQNIKLSVDGDKLKIDAPKGAVTPELFALIKDSKQALVDSIKKSKNAVSKIKPAPRSHPIKLSYAQKRLWFIDRLDQGSSHYNIPCALDVKGDFNLSAAQYALNEIIKRHEPLRTIFIEKDGEPAQIVLDSFQLTILETNIASLDIQSQNQRIAELVKHDAQLPFDLQNDLMLRASFIKHGKNDGILLFNMHHIAADGWSADILIQEFVNYYQHYVAQNVAQKSASLPPLTIQYIDYAYWQSERLSSVEVALQLEYWNKQLKDLPERHSIPLDYTRPSHQTFSGDAIPIELDASATSALRALANSQQVTLFMLLHAIWACLLSRYSDKDDIVIGTPVANRLQPELEPLIGYFVNSLVLKTTARPEGSFSDFLRHVKQINLDAQANQEIPFEMLVDALKPERSVQYSPLFQIMFSMNTNSSHALELPGIQFSLRQAERITAKYDLLLNAQDNGDKISLNFIYNTELFESATIDRIANIYRQFASAVCQNSSANLYDLPFGVASAKLAITQLTSLSGKDYLTESAIHELISQRANARPDEIAVYYRDDSLTFAELDRKANALAALIRKQQSKPCELIGLLVEPNLDMLIAILAILKSGAGYLPIDLKLPKERRDYILKDSGINILITDQLISSELPPDLALELIALEDKAVRAAIDLAPDNTTVFPCAIDNSNLAYVIYTSGTSGYPKGVMTEHRNLIAFIDEFQQQLNEFDLTENSPWMWNSSYAFDMSVKGLISLASGRPVVIASQEACQDPKLIVQLIVEHKIQVFNANPHMLAEVVDRLQEEGLNGIYLISGGEPIPKTIQAKIMAYCESSQSLAINAYGPTEATINSSYALLGRDSGIGKPTCNTSILLLDRHQQPVCQGAVGEIYIAGPGLARGYLNQDKLTAEKFLSRAFSVGQSPSSQSVRLYRSGDFARLKNDNNIEFIGRNDNQVKVRGYRIELEEIECQISALDIIKACLVVNRSSVEMPDRIVAYITLKQDYDPSKEHAVALLLREKLAKLLPGYMIPSHFVVLEKLPKTVTGKIDYKSLPTPESQGSEQNAPLTTGTQQLIASIWHQLLDIQISNINPDSEFFALGGHSLLAIRLIAKIRDTFDVEISVREVFENSRLRQLAILVEGKGTSRKIKLVANLTALAQYPASYSQRRLWFLNQLESNDSQYNIFGAFYVHGSFDIAIAEASFKTIIERHQSLRTVFRCDAESVYQKIMSEFEFSVQVQDLTLEESELQTQLIRQRVNGFSEVNFDLEKDLMLKVGYLKLSPSSGVFMLNMHHIASDGWSLNILVEEFSELYRAGLANTSPNLEPLAIQFSDYTLWQKQYLASDAPQRQMDYWTKQLADLPQVHQLPLDFVRPEFQTYRGERLTLPVGHELSKQLRVLASNQKTTLFMLFHAAFSLLISRYSAQEDIVIGTTVANRLENSLEKLIGFFVNTLVLRTRCKSNLSFKQFLAQVKEVNIDAQANQDIPFEYLVERLNPERNTSYNPLFQIFFSMSLDQSPQLNLPNVEFEPILSESLFSKFDLSLNVSGSEAFELHFEYNRDILSQGSLQNIAESYLTLLGAIVDDQNIPLSQISILSQQQQKFLIDDLNLNFHSDTDTDTDTDTNSNQQHYPTDVCIHELFEQQVLRSPDRTAVVFGDSRLTYDELNQRANQLAHYLIESGVTKESFVGICAERSLELMVGILAILKSGAAYLPLESSYPKERLSYMLEHSAVKLLLTQSHLTQQFDSALGNVVEIDQLTFVQDYPTENVQRSSIELASDNMAYIIYTSGSTGTPKGVVIEHKNMTNLLFWYAKKYALNENDRVLVMSAMGFDLTQKNLFAPLIVGASVEFATARYFDVNAIVDFIKLREITLTNCAPSVFYPLVEHPENHAKLTSLRCVLFGGEPIAFERLNAWLQGEGKNVQLVNMYGPTECTDIACAYDIPQNQINTSAPIGVANDNVKLFVLDQSLNLAPFGTPGELCIGGAGVSRGYLNQAELTQQKFIAHPDLCQPGKKLYRTGDMVKWKRNRQLEFIGRIDNQIKVRGFRVELGDIESCINQYPTVRQAVVTYHAAKQELRAYLVLSQSARLEIEKIKEFIRARLPAYMVPAAYLQLEVFPLNPHGKIERKALPSENLIYADNHYVAPSTRTEQQLSDIWKSLLPGYQGGTDKGETSQKEASQKEVSPKENSQEVSIHANFFELGGHSLLVTQMLHLIAREMNHKLHVKDIFQSPTIEKLARRIETQESSNAIQLTKSKALPGQARLSFSQYRVWFVEQLKGRTNEHNMLSAVEISGEFDHKILRDALQKMVDKHEILRTKFQEVDNRPHQIVESNAKVTLDYHHFESFDSAEISKRIEQLVNEHGTHCFDLTTLPLFKVLMIKKAEHRYILHFNIHHIICDGWSKEIFFSELLQTYQSILKNQPLASDQSSFQYVDYADWQTQWLQSAEASQQEGFWKQYLANCNEKLELPLQLSTNQREGEQSHQLVKLDPALVQRLKIMASQHKASLFNLMHTAFAVLIARATGKQDFNIGIPVTGRHIYGTQNMLGMFLNNLPLRHQIDLNKPFTTVLAQQTENLEAVLSHQDLPFEKIVEIHGCDRSKSVTPLFQVFFNMLSIPLNNFDTQQLDFSFQSSKTTDIENKFNLSLYLSELNDGFYIYSHFNKSIFSESYIAALLAQYQNVLAAVALNPDSLCHQISLHQISLAPVDQARTEIATIKRFSSASVYERFRDKALQRPDAVAIDDDDALWTYSQVKNAVNVMARRLLDAGIQKGDSVAVLAARSASSVISIMACLQVGAVYSMILPQQPVARLKQQLELTNTKALLVASQSPQDKTLGELLSAGQIALMTVESDLNMFAGQQAAEQCIAVSGKDPACISFTSGTSGIPKAIVGTHLGLCGYFEWYPDEFKLDQHDKFSLLSGLAHDPLQREIFGALCLGARLMIPNQDMYNSYQLAEWIAEKQVSVLHLTPALGEVIAHQASGAIDSIRRVFVTGEVLRTDTAQSLLRLSPLAHIFNCYGTSETQRAATYYRVDPDEFYGTIVFSGLKTKDTRVRIVNANNEDCALGEVGQVCIESHHLALGYLNENEASKAKFKPQQDGSTRYLTGDLGVPVNDHSFKYLGRADNQVNIRGFRIEIEEVEVNLKRLSEVSNASVTIIESQYLVAYIVPAAKSLDPAAVIESIKLQLRDLLPDYMLPKHYMFIDKIPLTENGKVNKVALPLLEHFNHEPAREQPKTDLGLKVRSLWSKLLEIDKDQISLTDNFFELGGHSLLLIKLITNIKTEFGLEIGIKTLFEINDLASMIQLIESMHNRQQVNRELAQVKQDEIEEVEF